MAWRDARFHLPDDCPIDRLEASDASGGHSKRNAAIAALRERAAAAKTTVIVERVLEIREVTIEPAADAFDDRMIEIARKAIDFSKKRRGSA